METKEKLTKKDLKNFIWDTQSNDGDFLYNDLGGVDLMMSAVRQSIEKMNKKDLLNLYEKAKATREKNYKHFRGENIEHNEFG
jgi:hypothetical protein